jgi:hypothetical protein
MQVTPSITLPATATPGMAPWRASMPAQDRLRAALRALVILACADREGFGLGEQVGGQLGSSGGMAFEEPVCPVDQQ